MIRLAALLALALAGGAHAHSKSVTTPADGAIVAEAPEIALDFDMPMRVIAFTLLRGGEGEEGVEVETESESGMASVTRYLAVPAEALEPGPYRVEWRGMSADGHPMQGGFAFAVDPEAEPEADD
ncbi:copper resistance CopC family protein [Jannaschia sp. W003]|uniref:copper resistance CopC family protein n=1 Tax=Jannaschia sp. W003 TaxID=2867012 RepID=UPI0021A6C4E4|nr:copper resistance CopC family protein [Jannaschia sp. W003]UWQ22087.1 copper resistance protein CopC [Jannaschia sp. W003]